MQAQAVRRRGFLLPAAATLLFGALPLAYAGSPRPAVSRPSEASVAFFESKVRPVLVARCYSCHSASSRPVQGGLRLDSREGLLRGGARGPALVPGDPDRSPLIRALHFTDEDLRMPPAGKLAAAEIAHLTRWVAMGAPWAGGRGPGAGGQQPPTPNTQHPTPNTPHWAFQPVRKPAVPRVRNRAWVKTPIDAFVLAELEKRGLRPTPPADRRTLIRRATYDLTGLPPTPAEIEAFLADPAPDAFARVVDRLLASQGYGERWGRHWLDVARYADSNGLDENLVFANAWRYRDYVIRALNADKPIHRFIQEQIAGDLLPPSPDDPSGFDRTIATGYLALGAKMLAEDDPVKQEEDILDEQVDTLGKTFMGMTLGCARCHDHKFDPISQVDYYALAGIFKSTRTMANFKVVAEWQEVPLVSPADREKLERVEAEIQAKKAAQASLTANAGEALLADARRRSADYLRVARELRERSAGADLKPTLAEPGVSLRPEARILEAEEYARGNVLRDRENYGRGIGVLVNAGAYPNFAEYEVAVPSEGPYQLDLRYASSDARPVRIFVNGVMVASNAAGGLTGGFFPDAQRWFVEGVFHLGEGKNLIRLERSGPFPHLDKLLLLPYPGPDYPRTPEQVAAAEGLVPEFLAQAEQHLRKGGAPGAELAFTLPAEPAHLFPGPVRTELERLTAEAAALDKQRPSPPRAMAVSEGAPADLRLHIRGDYQTLGKECPRAFPVVLAGANPPLIDRSRSGRLELAKWLTRPDHPLTARVMVNRVWRWHFGRGIVPSTDNFGLLGDRPSHPALLDWLASVFTTPNPGFGVQGSGFGRDADTGMGWSLKKLHRLIMLSSTYQQGSSLACNPFPDLPGVKKPVRQASPEVSSNPQSAIRNPQLIDPENRLLWRFNRRRLEAEAIRDGILAVSGQLDRTMGGTLLKFKDRDYVTSTANADPVSYRSNRRSVYLPVIRSALYDVYTAFDFGDPSVMNGDRPTTTVAPQALFALNSDLVLEGSRAMASSLLARADLDDAGRVRAAYEACYGRLPMPAETARTLAFLTRVEREYEATEPKPEQRRIRAWQSVCKALMAATEFIYLQ